MTGSGNLCDTCMLQQGSETHSNALIKIRPQLSSRLELKAVRECQWHHEEKKTKGCGAVRRCGIQEAAANPKSLPGCQPSLEFGEKETENLELPSVKPKAWTGEHHLRRIDIVEDDEDGVHSEIIRGDRQTLFLARKSSERVGRKLLAC